MGPAGEQVRKEPHCQLSTPPPAQKEPLTHGGEGLHGCPRTHALGVKVTPKRSPRGGGAALSPSLPGPAQGPAGRSQLPEGDVAGKEPVH